MGSMDTSRIGQLLGFSPKLSGAAETSANQSGGFADLLFGVMSNRSSNVQPAMTAHRVSTVLPVEHDTGASDHLAPRPLASPRALERSHGARGNEQAATPADQSSGAPGTGTPNQHAVSDKRPGAETSPAAECTNPGDAVESAPPAEGVETGDETSEDVDLQTEAEGTEGEETAAGDQGGEPSLDQEPQAAVVEIQQPVPEAPLMAAAVAIPGAAPVTGEAVPETDEDLAPVQPALATPQAAEDEIVAATPQSAAEGEPQAAENATIAVSTDAQADSPVAAEDPADTTPDLALALANEPFAGEAEAQAAAIARQNERRAEDSAGTFRRSAQTPRQRAAAASAGSTGAPAQVPAQNTPAPASAAATAATAGTPASTVLPLTPLAFAGENGTISGLPGWNLHLAQGNAARRPDFVANLRQHLQNLPAHEQVALGIQKSARDGGGSITLQLSPSELGRIHVKLDIDEEKNVRAAVSVERPATLDLLQRDAKALERALQDAGLKMDQGDLSFSLQGGDSESFAREFGNGGRDLAQVLADATEEELAAELAAQSSIVATGDGLVDVQI
jgi:flagellar hook-length control protein FliK